MKKVTSADHKFEKQIRDKAKEKFGRYKFLEIDDQGQVSNSDDGYWVEAHLFVSAEDMGDLAVGPAWSARCDCYNGHNSASGRCHSRNVTDPTRKEGDIAICEACRVGCATHNYVRTARE